MELTPNKMWERCLTIISDNIDPHQYTTWFKHTTFKSYDESSRKLTLNVPSQFFYEWIEAHYLDLLQKTISRVYGEGVSLSYCIQSALAEVEQESEKKADTTPILNNTADKISNVAPTFMMAHTLSDFDSQLRTSYLFDNFVEGESNRLARSVGEAIAKNPAKTFNPFFIYGPSGCGKTHLVNAIGNRTKELHPELRVLYLSAHLFTVQYTDAVRQNKVNDFIGFYQTIDMLIIDDVQELSGKMQTQNTFFHIFNHLHLNNKQLILTADRPPVAIKGLEDRLLTRFKWGLQAEILRPTQQMRFAILKNKVRKDGLDIPDNVINYISANINESVRDLEGIINSLMAYSVVYNCNIDIQLVQRVMKGFVGEQKKQELTIEDIKKQVANYFHIDEQELCSKSRKQPISNIRQIAIYLASQLTTNSTVQIGQQMGGRNHSTVLYSIESVKNAIDTNKQTRKDINELKRLLTDC